MTGEPSLKGTSPGNTARNTTVKCANLILSRVARAAKIELPLKAECDKAKPDLCQRRTCKDVNWERSVLQKMALAIFFLQQALMKLINNKIWNFQDLLEHQ